MPYTPEELQNMEWYQDLIAADERRYIDRKQSIQIQNMYSSSLGAPVGGDGSQLIRDQDNTVLFFENPYLNKIDEDGESKVVHNLEVKILKTKENDSIINEVLDRTFREL